MSASVVLPVLAALLHGPAFLLYCIQSKLGKSKPNVVSWLIWAFLATLNALSFRAMSDTVVALQFITGSIGCIATFVYVLAIGKFEWPNARERIVFGIGILAIVWLKLNDPLAANLMVAVTLLISSEPTIRGVWENPANEKPLPWMMWAMAFTLSSVNTYLYKGGWTLMMVTPVLAIFIHAAPAMLCLRRLPPASEKG